MTMRGVVRGLGVLVPTALLSLLLASCATGPKENPVSTGVANPDPKDALSGVTLENEAVNLDRIRSGNGIPRSKVK